MIMSTISLTPSNSDASFTANTTSIAATTSHDATTIVTSLMPSTTISHDTTTHVLCKLRTKYTSDIKIYA